MKTIVLTDQQYKNLIAFLGRVDLKGSEAAAFFDLASALENPNKIIKEEKKKDEK